MARGIAPFLRKQVEGNEVVELPFVRVKPVDALCFVKTMPQRPLYSRIGGNNRGT